MTCAKRTVQLEVMCIVQKCTAEWQQCLLHETTTNVFSSTHLTYLSKSYNYHIVELCYTCSYLNFKTASAIVTSIVKARLDACRNHWTVICKIPRQWFQRMQHSFAHTAIFLPVLHRFIVKSFHWFSGIVRPVARMRMPRVLSCSLWVSFSGWWWLMNGLCFSTITDSNSKADENQVVVESILIIYVCRIYHICIIMNLWQLKAS